MITWKHSLVKWKIGAERNGCNIKNFQGFMTKYRESNMFGDRTAKVDEVFDWFMKIQDSKE